MALMSLRSHSYVKASMVLTRTDHLFIHHYIRSLLNNMLIPICIVRTGLESVPYSILTANSQPYGIKTLRLKGCFATSVLPVCITPKTTELYRQLYIYIYIYIYIPIIHIPIYIRFFRSHTLKNIILCECLNKYLSSSSS